MKFIESRLLGILVVTFGLWCLAFSITNKPQQTKRASKDTSQTGKASFYHDSFDGQETSSGETYDMYNFTAAHRTFKFGTLLLVTNKKNNKSVVVKVNDRGPFKRSRIIDLSYAAARKIHMVPFGVVQVKTSTLNYLNSYPLSDALLQNNEIWDCYGKRRELRDKTIFIWRTENLRHALYMASSLSLEQKKDVLIKVNGVPGKRSYSLLLSEIDSREKDKLISNFRNDGFFACKSY